MTGDLRGINAALEGDDVPQPLRVHVFSDGCVNVAGELQMLVSGPGALASLARRLIASGFNPDEQELDIHRNGGEFIERVLLRDALLENTCED
jgi:hypothetical protein